MLPQHAQFCITPAEEALGEVPLHMASLPDAAFLHVGISLTTLPGHVAHVTRLQAIETVNRMAGISPRNARHEDAILADAHSPIGEPAVGTPVWIVNLASVKDANAPGWTDFVEVDAGTGQPMDEFIQSPIPASPAYP